MKNVDGTGSTRLWEENAEMMKKAIQVHHRVVRRAIREHSGYEVKTEGELLSACRCNSLDA